MIRFNVKIRIPGFLDHFNVESYGLSHGSKDKSRDKTEYLLVRIAARWASLRLPFIIGRKFWWFGHH
jgi:hypothetical protein